MPLPSRFTPRNYKIRIVQEAGWAPKPVKTGAENPSLPGFDPQTVQLAVSHYNDYTIPAQIEHVNIKLILKDN
jgi:hypothetical protein